MPRRQTRSPTTPEANASGKNWQEYSLKLLSVHYARMGYTYQAVSDRTHGDNGLEGWVDETGEAFQAYSGECSDTAAKLKKSQKKKITDDLEKLVTYSEFWESVFAPRNVRLKKWKLFVPETLDKTILKHLGEKAKELADKKLSFIAEDFQGYIVTPENYPEAHAICRDPHLAEKLIKVRDPSSEAVNDHGKTATEFTENLRAKLSKLLPSRMQQDLENQVRDRTKHHLRRENYLSDLADRFPSHADELTEFLALKADQIKTDESVDCDTPGVRYRRVREDLDRSVKEIAEFANATQRIVIVDGTIAYWLGECSLGFEG